MCAVVRCPALACLAALARTVSYICGRCSCDTRRALQGQRKALLYGGCQICAGTTLTEDPSGSDSTDLWFLDTSQLTAAALAAGNVSATWNRVSSRGFAPMPPRKHHDALAADCGVSDTECSVLVYGGWNPRWPVVTHGIEALRRLNVVALSWSLVPADGVDVRLCPLLFKWRRSTSQGTF